MGRHNYRLSYIIRYNGTVHDLPVRRIVSNIGTASYYLAKHLVKLLSPLKKSKYTVTNTVEFIRLVKNLKVPVGYYFVSFENLYLQMCHSTTHDLILKRIYDKNEITTSLTRKEMKELLILCTKNVHFTFNGEIYSQQE